MDDWEAEERARIIAASGSGGSAQGVPPQMAGTLKFGQHAFGQVPGGPVPPLTDADGNPLVANMCDTLCAGSHIWTDANGVRSYCPGPPQE